MTPVINYMLNIKEELKERKSSYLEIQLVIFSLWTNRELNRDGATPEERSGDTHLRGSRILAEKVRGDLGYCKGRL